MVKNKIETLYAVPWYDCNLNCPHCHVKNNPSEQDFNNFLSSLINVHAQNVILFGGEPTFYFEKFCKILETNKINSVSTNLMLYDNWHVFIPILKAYNIQVATSWNIERFYTSELLLTWLHNVKKVVSSNIDVLVLITLTPELLRTNFNEVLNIFDMMERNGIEKFLFEPYIGEIECNSQADEWLCKFHTQYKGGMENLLESRLENWNCACENVYTLEPNGSIKKGCPDSLINKKSFCFDCLSCELSYKCNPCMLQKSCSYPKKLLKLIQSEK